MTAISSVSGTIPNGALIWDGSAWRNRLVGDANIATSRALSMTGYGSPQGVVAAPLGAQYLNLAGGVGATLWVKESGMNTNTGWAAK